VGGEHARRADGAGVLVGLLVVSLAERGDIPDVVDEDAHEVHPPWPAPSGQLVGQAVHWLVFAAGRDDQGERVTEAPLMDRDLLRFAKPQAFLS
jgi:hypothetical protein